jgi:hypothetical protein
LPISETTVGVPEANGTECARTASTETPRNIAPRIVLMSTRVVRAFRACGSRKMLTLLEMASVPDCLEPARLR